MARYFFNTVDGRRYPDEEGAELPDLEAARRKATLVLAELLREQPLEVWDTGRMGVEVTTETGDTVFSLNVATQAAKNPA